MRSIDREEQAKQLKRLFSQHQQNVKKLRLLGSVRLAQQYGEKHWRVSDPNRPEVEGETLQVISEKTFRRNYHVPPEVFQQGKGNVRARGTPVLSMQVSQVIAQLPAELAQNMVLDGQLVLCVSSGVQIATQDDSLIFNLGALDPFWIASADEYVNDYVPED